MTNVNTFYTQQSIESRITQIRANTAPDAQQCETAPDGRFISEVNAELYRQLHFLQSVLEQSVISFPVTIPPKR